MGYLARMQAFFLLVHSWCQYIRYYGYFRFYLDRTAIQLSTHADMAVPFQWMDSDKASVERREDVMNNHGVPIKVASENLK